MNTNRINHYMPSSKPKYSGLLSDSQVKIINHFCQLHDCSKSEVIGILLDQWDKNDRPKLDTVGLTFDEDKLTKLVKEIVANQVSNLESTQVNNQVPNDLSYSTLAFHVAKNNELVEQVSNRVKNLLAPLEQLRKEITIDVLNEVMPILSMDSVEDDSSYEETNNLISLHDDNDNESSLISDGEDNSKDADISPLEDNLNMILPSRGKSQPQPPKDKEGKLTITTSEDAIEFLKSVPKELTGKELEQVLELSPTYISKYKATPNKEMFDRVRPVLELLTPPEKKGGKWVNDHNE